ncbi:glycosyltransferase family 4 protein [Spirosoma sordidisoli]|uniref:Glycosyltransferase family 1 protein n=1 Tax=Spirosoma sordidisoli TaxID=2502893 RepID=A0A4Q2UKR2_9BACT|nr:glycosyltransferase family 1 protein [Spirosoma sordidisoli]RYC70127.1 glycosyltransferase family 1 protein [Spirosoma sordidisoli]
MNQIIFDCERMKYINTGLYYFCLNLGKALLQNSSREKIAVFIPNRVAASFGPSVPILPQQSLQKFFMPSVSQYQLWHCTYQNSNYLPRRNRKIKVLLTIHDLNFLYEDKSASKKARCLSHLQENINRSDAIVCISEFTRNDVLTHCDVGNRAVHVIYNGTNGLTKPVLEEKSYRPAVPFLFNIGAIARKKNQHQILPLLQSNPSMELVLAGRHEDKSYANYIRQQASELNVDDRTHLINEVTEGEKSWYYHNCQALVMPSLAEGFGLPITEAMSVGKPVFLSKHTAMTEIGKDLAFYFQDFDNMHDDFQSGMLHYRKAGSRIQEAMKAYSATFNWEDAARKYLDVYRSLLG